MPTQTKENYLKAIYFLDQKSQDVSLTALSREMRVSVPTTNNMVKNLQEIGWIDYTRYKPIRLTEKGRKAAARIVRKHRLTEMFLTRIMGFGWEEVHDIAEDVEHVQSDKLFDRMDELLGFPNLDPHGSPIPDKEGNIEEHNYISLSEVAEGQRVRLRSLSQSSKELLLYLNHKKISLGTELMVIGIEAFDRSYEVAYDRYHSVILSHEVCRQLEVEIISTD